MDRFKEWIKNNKPVFTILVLLAVAAAAEGSMLYNKSKQYNISMQNRYRQTFYDLADSINNIDVSLSKGLLTDNPKHLALISSEIQRDSSYAKALLGQLPITDTSLDNTQKFLAQVSDYTIMLTSKSINNQKITDEEYDTMANLSRYSTTLTNSILELEERLLSSDGNFDEVISVSAEAHSGGKEEDPGNQFQAIENQFLDYPSLIYDGPFSDHIERMEPEMLKGAREVTEDEAKEVAGNFLSFTDISDITAVSQSEGKIKTYGFVATINGDNRQIFIDVTKAGGYVISMLDTKTGGEENLSTEETIEKGAEFLKSKGFKDLKYSYYEKGQGNVTVNFAATQGDIFLYPDLLKVKISTDDGSIIGFEAKNYISHHKVRTNVIPTVSTTEAQKNLNPKLTVDSVNLCIIPLETGVEVLCYEFKGKFNNKTYLYYVNANTASEESIKLVVDTENGVLTM